MKVWYVTDDFWPQQLTIVEGEDPLRWIWAEDADGERVFVDSASFYRTRRGAAEAALTGLDKQRARLQFLLNKS